MVKTNIIGDTASPGRIPASNVHGSTTTALPARMDVCPPRNQAIHRTSSSGTRISASPANPNSCAVLSCTFSMFAPKNFFLSPLHVFNTLQPPSDVAHHAPLLRKPHLLVRH